MKVFKNFSTILFLLACFNTSRAQVPHYNSFLSASAVLFLDFDGHYVSGSSWNWNGPIDAQPAGLSSEDIRNVFNRVAEDYRPFNVNITTDSTVYLAAPFDKRMRVIVTVTSQWYGSTGGISYVGSFLWGDETPAFVFSNVLDYNSKYIAEACAHESGHTLGLQHQSTYDADCNKTEEYATGTGSGEIGWAPIMGMNYYKNFTTWHNGPNTYGCSEYQDDLEIIAGDANGFGYRPDDHSNLPDSATRINLQVPYIYLNGIIGKPADVDLYSFDLSQPTMFTLNVVPQNVGSNNSGADIDLKVSLLNSIGDTNAVYNPADRLEANIDTMLNIGKYYLAVEATGNKNHSDYGSLGLYYLSGSINRILPFQSFVLKSGFSNGDDILQWNFTSDEKVFNIVIEISADGEHFEPLVSLPGNANNYVSKHFPRTGFYRLKAVMATDQKVFYSNIVNTGQPALLQPFRIQSTVVTDIISLTSPSAYSYSLYDASGRLVQQGKLVKGFNTIGIQPVKRGILYLRMHNSSQAWTEKLIKH